MAKKYLKKRIKCFNCKKRSYKFHVELLTGDKICEECVSLCVYAILKERYYT